MPEPTTLPVGSPTDAAILDAIQKANNAMDERWTAVQESIKQGADKQAAITTEVEKIAPLMARVEALATARRHELPDDAPLDDETGNKAATAGGWKSLGFKGAMNLPSNHQLLRPNDADDIKTLHDHQDACVIKFFMKLQKHGKTIGPEAVRRQMSTDVDFLTYIRLRERMGFGKADDLQKALVEGNVFVNYKGETDELITAKGYRTKANEIHHPDTGGAGVNLDFTILSAQLIQKLRLELVVAAQFERLPLTRSSQKVPAQSADAMGVWGGGTQIKIPPQDALGTGTSPSNVFAPFANPNFYSQLAFPYIQFDVEHLLTLLIWNDDMEEDSIVQWVPIMRDQAAYGGARSLDRTILDGDTAATHRDLDVTVSNDFRKAIDGLRKYSVNYDLDNTGGVFDIDDLHTLAASLGTYGLKSERIVVFIPARVWFQLRGASTGSGDLLRRVDTIGADRATLRTGVVGQPYGIDIVISEFARTDTDVTGIRGGSGNTKSVVIAANRDRFKVGQFNELRIETERYPLILTNAIIADVRVDFQPWDEHATTAGSFNPGFADVPCNVMFNNG